MSSSSSRNERRLAAKNGGREGGDTAATSLHTWVRKELSLLIAGQGPGWVGKKVVPKEPETGGCRGCGTIGKPSSLTMLTRPKPDEKAVLFTLVMLCEECAGDKEKSAAVGEKVFGPKDPTPIPAPEEPPDDPA